MDEVADMHGEDISEYLLEQGIWMGVGNMVYFMKWGYKDTKWMSQFYKLKGGTIPLHYTNYGLSNILLIYITLNITLYYNILYLNILL